MTTHRIGRTALAVALALPVGLSGQTPRGGVPTAHGWFDEIEPALAAAKAQHKGLLIDFGGSDWCGPCIFLKKRIMTQPAFIERASAQFILVDIDDLAGKGLMPAGRKERYKALEARYGVGSFPTVVLTTPDGLAYAQTTYHQSINDPVAYWEYLQPLRAQGPKFDAAITKAKGLTGAARAQALVDGLSEIQPDFVLRFYPQYVAELRRLAPADPTGYLAFLDGRKAVGALQQWANDEHKLATLDPVMVDTAIATHAIQGEALQDALIVKAIVQIARDAPVDALHSLQAMLAAQTTRTHFDHGEFVPLDSASIATVSQRLAAGLADPANRLAQYRALHRVMEFDLPDRYEISCGEGVLRPNFMVRESLAREYGQALLASTAQLSGEARAKALGQGLEGTQFPYIAPISDIVVKAIPSLVGATATKTYLPAWYQDWKPTVVPSVVPVNG